MKKIWITLSLLVVGLLFQGALSVASPFDFSNEMRVTLIGRVYIDQNGNGAYDDGELGLPGVKIVTSYGEVITTDIYGRYSIPIVQQTTGNYILKLDVKSLPQNYRLTTENPVVIRISAGIPSEVNFGVETNTKKK